ncbi:hypothetical protein MK378_10775 [Streptococcus sanguinis]|nr:hypothetical protein [Streptococcus sp. IsoGale022]MCY7024791.1 hypothetical protein [Streptococcus sanguinis]MDQ8692672.1 hypothetical protein [Streptococcus sp. IsoGale022]
MTIEDKRNRRVGHVTVFSDTPDSVVEFGEQDKTPVIRSVVLPLQS